MKIADETLTDLHKRCIDSMGTGATIARHAEYMLSMIEEIQEARGGKKPADKKAKDEATTKTKSQHPPADVAPPAAPEPTKAELKAEAKAEAESAKAELKAEAKAEAESAKAESKPEETKTKDSKDDAKKSASK